MSSPFQCGVDLSQICNPGEDAPPVFSMPALTAIGLPSFDEAMNDLGCCFWRAFRQIYYGLILRPNLGSPASSSLSFPRNPTDLSACGSHDYPDRHPSEVDTPYALQRNPDGSAPIVSGLTRARRDCARFEILSCVPGGLGQLSTCQHQAIR